MKRKKDLLRRVVAALLLACTVFGCVPVLADSPKPLKILFTHDVHSYFIPSVSEVDGVVREHGNSARLMTLLRENSDESTLYLDAGDFAMGTLLQAGYTSEATELQLLGRLGCAVTTFGNHEFDLGGYGAAEMLRAAKASGSPLPQFVQSNMVLTGDLTEEQQALADAMAEYGAKEYTILDVNGVRVAVFGLLGIDGISCAPTSGMEFVNYIEAAKSTVKKIGDSADVIVCLSHSGTNGNGTTGEDIELAKAVPEIDVIVSGHTHTTYPEVVRVGDTVIGSAGEYLSYVGEFDLTVSADGVSCTGYRVIPCDESVAEDPEMVEILDTFKRGVEASYLVDENIRFDEVLCHSDFDFITMEEMGRSNIEYNIGDLIADSYLYAAEQNGIHDIDVALVGLGTIRGSFRAGDITTANAFEICSLGMGGDGSAGHPILTACITGKELKLLAELDVSLGSMVSYIKMSYSGLQFTYNTKRMLLDKVTEIRLLRADGTTEEIEDDKLYKVACNMYAANMLGMLNGLTKGILSIAPKNEDGSPVGDLYDRTLKNIAGGEIKEWVALKNYLSSFDKVNGVPQMPDRYRASQGRKNPVAEGGLALIRHPGATTIAVIALPMLIVALIVVLLLTRKRRKARRAEKRARKAAKKAAAKS